MTDKERREKCTKTLNFIFQGQREGKSNREISEGIRAGLASDYLSLDEGLAHGATVADPGKYHRATDGKDEQPRRTRPLERDIIGRIERAKRERAAEMGSPEYRAKVIKQKRAKIHKVMNERGTNELTAKIRGYDVTLLRLPETDKDGRHKLKLFVDGNEIPDRQFDDALAEVAGLNDSKAFNMAAEVGKEFRDQAGIQGARTVTQAGMSALTSPVRALSRGVQKSDAMTSEILRLFFRMILSISRSR